MRKAILLILAALAAGLFWLLLRGSTALPPTDTQTPTTHRRPSAATSHGATNRGAQQSEPTQQASRSQPSPSVAGRFATITGRCVDQDNRPLAGVQVKMQLEQGGDLMQLAETQLLHGKEDWTAPKLFETGADGRFAFSVVPPRARRTPITATCTGRVSAHVWPEQLKADDQVDLGDLVMAQGCQLKGHLTDLAGHDVARTSLRLRPVASQETNTPSWFGSATTDTTGRFSVWSPMPPGEYEVTIAGGVRPKRIVLAAPEEFVALELQRPGVAQTIEGQLLDLSGQPLRLRLEAKSGSGNKTWSTRPNESGRFVFGRREDDPNGPVDIRISVEYGWAAGPTSVAWDSRDLHLSINNGVAVPIQVVDGVTGAPFEGRLGVRLVPMGGPGQAYTKSRRLHQVGEHPDGRLSVPSTLPGGYMLSVETATSRYAPTPYQRVNVGAASPETTVVYVWPPALLNCHVLLDGKTASPGSKVELLQLVGAKPDKLPKHYKDPRNRPTFDSRDSVTTATVLAEAITGPDGHARLVAPRGGPFAISVTGNHHPYYRYGQHIKEDATLPIEVASAASLAIKITPWPLPLHGAAALSFGNPQITYTDGSAQPDTSDYRINEHGRVRIDALPTGIASLKLALFAAKDGRNHFATVYAKDVALEPSVIRNVSFDVADLVPTEQQLRFTANNAPASGATIHLEYPPSKTGRDHGIRGQLDAEGALRLGTIDAQAQCWIRLPRSKLACPVPRFSTSAREQVFDLRTCDLVLQVLQSDGATPLPKAMIVKGPNQSDWLGTTDNNGQLAIGEVILGTYRVSILAKKGAAPNESASGEFAMRYAQPCIVHTQGSQVVSITAPPESGY